MESIRKIGASVIEHLSTQVYSGKSRLSQPKNNNKGVHIHTRVSFRCVGVGVGCQEYSIAPDNMFIHPHPPLKKLRRRTADFRGPASSELYISGGGSPGEKSLTVQSQLRPLATRTPSLGRCGQGAWLESLLPIRLFCLFV